MNIDSIKTYSVDSRVKSKYGLYDALGDRDKYESVCKNDKLNRGYYGGSFTGKNEAVASAFNRLGETFTDKIFRSGVFKSLLDVFEEKSVVASSLVALFVAGMLRPVTNLAMAGDKDRDDSIYAASHAISSAAIGFIVSSIVMHPFDAAFRKIKSDPKKYLKGLEELFDVKEIGARKLEKSKVYKKLSKTAQFIPDSLIMGVPKAMLTIALIPPILKYVFHMEKKKNKAAAQNVQVQNIKQNDAQYINNLVKGNPVFKAVEGGTK